MRQAKKMLAPLAGLLMLAGCATTPEAPYDYTAFRAAAPRSILVVPPINSSVDVEAPSFYLSTITRPVAERGYYVFPVNVVKRLLEEEGLADANLVHESDPRILAEMFGADAVLYVSIERWDAQYSVIDTTVTIALDYVLRSGSTGDELWSESRMRQLSSSSSSGGGGGIGALIVDVIVAAVEKASPNYTQVAKQTNAAATTTAHQGVPAGPYHPMYGKDAEHF